MSNEKTAAATGITTTDKLNNDQAVRTQHDTRTATAPGRWRHKPLKFHKVAAEDQETVHTLCGKAFPKRHTVRAGDPSADPREKVMCESCRMLQDLDADLRAQEDRRRRAEAIAERVLRFLEREA